MKWTPKEEQLLLKNFKQLPKAELTKMFNRNLRTIEVKYYNMRNKSLTKSININFSKYNQKLHHATIASQISKDYNIDFFEAIKLITEFRNPNKKISIIKKSSLEIENTKIRQDREIYDINLVFLND